MYVYVKLIVITPAEPVSQITAGMEPGADSVLGRGQLGRGRTFADGNIQSTEKEDTMKKTGRRLLALLLAGALLLGIPVGTPVFAAPADTVVIYHTNDMHASMISDDFNLAHVKSIRESTPNSLLLDAGDAIQGQPFSMLTEGKGPFELMNAAAVSYTHLTASPGYPVRWWRRWGACCPPVSLSLRWPGSILNTGT